MGEEEGEMTDVQLYLVIGIPSFVAALGILTNGLFYKDPGAVAMAKKRAASLTAARRKEIAKAAAEARWKKKAKAK
jgi:hypothetical protein